MNNQELIIEREVKVMRSLAESLLQTCNRIERTLNPPIRKKKGGLTEAEKAKILAQFRKSLNRKAASGN